MTKAKLFVELFIQLLKWAVEGFLILTCTLLSETGREKYLIKQRDVETYSTNYLIQSWLLLSMLAMFFLHLCRSLIALNRLILPLLIYSMNSLRKIKPITNANLSLIKN